MPAPPKCAWSQCINQERLSYTAKTDSIEFLLMGTVQVGSSRESSVHRTHSVMQVSGDSILNMCFYKVSCERKRGIWSTFLNNGPDCYVGKKTVGQQGHKQGDHWGGLVRVRGDSDCNTLMSVEVGRSGGMWNIFWSKTDFSDGLDMESKEKRG